MMQSTSVIYDERLALCGLLGHKSSVFLCIAYKLAMRVTGFNYVS